MIFEWSYISAIISSTLRMCSPILLCSLAAAVCSKAGVFNIAMEGCMMVSAFFAIVVNYYSGGSVLLAILAGILSSMLISAVLAVLIIRLKASPVVAGMAINTMSGGLTTYLMYVFFHTKGLFQNPALNGLSKLTPFFASAFPELAQMFYGLTTVDYLSWIIAILVQVFLYRTVIGYRIRAIGINPEAARSLGTPVEKYQFWTMTLSGIFCGLAGVLLSMGSVTLFIQNITSGKGYIAMTANNLGKSHPLGVAAASLFFGACQSLGSFLQQAGLKGQITGSIPYAATVLASVVSSIRYRRQKEKKIREAISEN
ncbi:MAG: ABC transporter permease [Erysipelotrichaceae bacterium]|nr:ABC transporter permease [Erysipelotrichaceae bacterium]MBQ5804747.1 ABC transporter permease [Erysipelotrichaceae bacterium]